MWERERERMAGEQTRQLGEMCFVKGGFEELKVRVWGWSQGSLGLLHGRAHGLSRRSWVRDERENVLGPAGASAKALK